MWIFIASKHQRWEELHLIEGQSLPIKTKTSQPEPAKYDTEILNAFFLSSKQYVSHNNYANPFCQFTLDRIQLLYNLLPFFHPHFTALDFMGGNSRKTWHAAESANGRDLLWRQILRSDSCKGQDRNGQPNHI